MILEQKLVHPKYSIHCSLASRWISGLSKAHDDLGCHGGVSYLTIGFFHLLLQNLPSFHLSPDQEEDVLSAVGAVLSEQSAEQIGQGLQRLLRPNRLAIEALVS